MRLLNPTYDTVFKYLLEDLEIAKGLISRIMGKEIVEITHLPREQTTIELDLKYLNLPLHRQDFVAAIKTKDDQGNEKIEKVMIEMQKSPFKPEVHRFRQYISEKYHHRTVLQGKELDLPIITIYILEKAFNRRLPAVLYVKNEYYDRLSGRRYEGERDEFVDLLVHEAYFIQCDLLPQDFKNDLIRVLSIFSPHYRIRLGKSERYIELPDELIDKYKDRVLRLIIKRLQLAERDRKLTTALDLEISYEQEWEETLDRLEKMDKALKEARRAAAEAKRKVEEERRRAEEAKREVEEERRRAEEAKQKLLETAKLLKQMNLDIDLIAEKTGLPKEEIEKL